MSFPYSCRGSPESGSSLDYQDERGQCQDKNDSEHAHEWPFTFFDVVAGVDNDSVEQHTDGDQIEQELQTADAQIERHLGEKPKDFAYTGATWSSIAEQKVKSRYRFGRLWIADNYFLADGRRTSVAELMGVGGADEADGGPANAARYITLQSNRYRLPAMEICGCLMNELDQFRNYLEGALAF